MAGRRTKPAAAPEAEEPKVDAVEETAAPEEPTGASVTVEWNGNSRTYSKEIHGKDFKKLAKQFAGQYPDAVIT